MHKHYNDITKTPQARMRDYFNKRLSSLKGELQSFIPHYKELSEFIQPRRGRFFTQDRNKGTKKHSSIINSHASFAHQTARSGMMAGTMSPARPWFDLKTYDPALDEFQPVKEWLFASTTIIRDIFNQSNFYNQAPTLLGEMLLFATGCMSHVDDFNDVARFYTHTAGSYMIGQDERLKVNTMVREFEWSVYQIVRDFGYKNCSVAVQQSWDKGNYDQWYPVVHFVEPNPDYKKNNPLSMFKRFRSVYYEPSEIHAGKGDGKFLSMKGYDDFPAYVPRWDVTGEDIYGTDCPAMTALGDIKGLQVEEKRKAQGIDKQVNPPLQGPASLKNVPVSSLPGGLNIFDVNDKNHKLSSVYDVQIDLSALRADIGAVEERINRAFYVDMFLAISQMQGIQPRNELDLMTRNEERLLMLGPVLERLQGEFHDALIDHTFNQCLRAGILPPAPEELQGRPLRVRYVSTLAMAQRAVATQGIDRIMSYAGNIAGMGWQEVYDKIDADQSVDEYANALGVPPKIVRSDDAVALIRQQRAEEQKAAAQLEAIQSLANSAKMATDAKTGDENVLTDLAGGAS